MPGFGSSNGDQARTIWWADLGSPAGSEAGYQRPVLIIQDDRISASQLRTVVIVPFTSNINAASADGNALLSEQETGLPKASVAVATLVRAIDKEDLVELIGTINEDALVRVEIALLTVIDMVG
jgi:mRNA interferase MazF